MAIWAASLPVFSDCSTGTSPTVERYKTESEVIESLLKELLNAAAIFCIIVGAMRARHIAIEC